MGKDAGASYFKGITQIQAYSGDGIKTIKPTDS